MRPPPDALGRVEPHSATAARRRQDKRARRINRRAYYIQCDTCLATATGRWVYGRLVSAGFPVTAWGRHADCGGKVHAYDITGEDDS